MDICLFVYKHRGLCSLLLAEVSVLTSLRQGPSGAPSSKVGLVGSVACECGGGTLRSKWGTCTNSHIVKPTSALM